MKKREEKREREREKKTKESTGHENSMTQPKTDQ